LKQIRIYFIRDLLTKLTNKQYILINFLEAPVLALIISLITKYFSGTSTDPTAYVFMDNENLPAYLLISVIVFLFLGMTVSAEEIIKDRKLLQRESFLNLSRASYLHTKILIMFAISAIQSLSFVVVGNLIFEIQGMLLPYWIILFTTACFANLLGLNLSSGLNSVVAIYIMIPFLVIPMILFCGVLVKYDKLHPGLSDEEYVPLIGNLMPSRWAYEALAVEQFKNNKFEKIFFEINQDKSTAEYLNTYLISTLKNRLQLLELSPLNGDDQEAIQSKLDILNNQIAEVEKLDYRIPLYQPPEIIGDPLSEEVVTAIKNYLDYVEELGRQININSERVRKMKQDSLIAQYGMKEYSKFEKAHVNESLADMVLNENTTEHMVEIDNRFIRKFKLGYMKPTSTTGKAHLYAPIKRLGRFEYETLWYNMVIIWLYTILLYLTLRSDLLRRVINISETRRLRRLSLRQAT
jgi:hypothetical protein